MPTPAQIRLVIAMAKDWTDPVVVRDAPDRVPFVIEQLIEQLEHTQAILRAAHAWKDAKRFCCGTETGPDAGSACVYFVRCGRFIKIGHARRLDKRLVNLQLSNPERLKVWLSQVYASQFMAFRAEKAFHRQFRDLHHRGEWFRLAPEIVAFVRQQRRGARQTRSAAA